MRKSTLFTIHAIFYACKNQISLRERLLFMAGRGLDDLWGTLNFKKKIIWGSPIFFPKVGGGSRKLVSCINNREN